MTALDDQIVMPLQMAITLRIATKADLPKLEWYGQYKHYRHLFRRTFYEQRQGRRLILIADSNNFPIGTLFIQLQSTRNQAPDGSFPAYFYSFRVMEMFRGQGIGTRLIEEAEAIVQGHGSQWVRIAVAKDNPKARQLYERLNYRIFTEDPGNWSYLDHKGRICYVSEPCWLLEKKL